MLAVMCRCIQVWLMCKMYRSGPTSKLTKRAENRRSAKDLLPMGCRMEVENTLKPCAKPCGGFGTNSRNQSGYFSTSRMPPVRILKLKRDHLQGRKPVGVLLTILQ